jgi:hypothetical protein
MLQSENTDDKLGQVVAERPPILSERLPQRDISGRAVILLPPKMATSVHLIQHIIFIQHIIWSGASQTARA